MLVFVYSGDCELWTDSPTPTPWCSIQKGKVEEIIILYYFYYGLLKIWSAFLDWTS